MANKPKNIVELGRNTQSNWEVKNFNAELKFYGNDTFHIRIENLVLKQVIFIGIGKFEKGRKEYKFTFTQAFGNGGQENIADTMNLLYENGSIEQGKRSGLNQVRFVDHNGQIYYFA
jgi:hypothetical protein